MGYGDEIMATGMARGANARGKRIAFGDGNRIIFSPWSEQMFRHNPNIAYPGDERADDIEWIRHHKGHRLYNSLNHDRTRWVWNMDFRPKPGELFFDDAERAVASAAGSGFILIEANVPRQKSVASNKDWGVSKYQAAADRLMADGHRVMQFDQGRDRLARVGVICTSEFRLALAVLSRAALYIGPEGGLHHGAAAVGIPAVVLFGGFIPAQVTGYPIHTNLTGGATACGKLNACRHCEQAMAAIGVDDVLTAARLHLKAECAA